MYEKNVSKFNKYFSHFFKKQFSYVKQYLLEQEEEEKRSKVNNDNSICNAKCFSLYFQLINDTMVSQIVTTQF